MTTPQPGDTIRVLIEATVGDWGAQKAAVAANGGTVVSLEVLPKPPAVGEVLTSLDDYLRVPTGAVLLDQVSGERYMRAGSWFLGTGGSSWREYELVGVPRTVVYLP